MKTSSYCGAEYRGDAVMDAVDHTLLESIRPAPVPKRRYPDSSEGGPPPSRRDAGDGDEPKIFRCLWRIDPFDANRLLKKFLEADIEFQIELFDIPEPARSECILGGVTLTKQIDVYVHWDDKEEAMEILAADWKV